VTAPNGQQIVVAPDTLAQILAAGPLLPEAACSPAAKVVTPRQDVRITGR
jgi:hypothetical protein